MHWQEKFDRIDTAFLNDEKEVVYELMDLEGRIVNPLSKEILIQMTPFL